MRTPADLIEAIEIHKRLHGKDPVLLSFRTIWHVKHLSFFSGRLHTLCCGRGFLYEGIPAILTASKYVEDFMIGY